MKPNSKLKKTIKIGKKRYKKSKPAELFLVETYTTTYTRDDEGETIDDTTETVTTSQLMTLRELSQEIKNQVGFSRFMEYQIDLNSAYFDSDYHDNYDGSEGKFTVLVRANGRALEHLKNHVEMKQFRIKQKDLEETKLYKQRQQERELAEAAKKPKLEVLEGQAWLSRKSQAKLTLIKAS
jgi:hypothetical protein